MTPDLRYLRQYKASIFRRKRTGTKPGKMLKNVIPIKSFDFKAHGPGHVEADTVAHCGTSLSGTFIWTVTFTDVYSGWTENRAIWSKHTDDVLSALIDFRQKAPFQLLSFNTDNGTEFLSQNIMRYLSCDENQRKVLFTRSRAYKKNDNCHVEQKNWTHVREIFGYDRFDDEDLVPLMNEIYTHYYNVLSNFFVPQLKLVQKTRIGAKYTRKYDSPMTPYQRLMQSPALTMGQKEDLKRKYESLNPFNLKQECQRAMRRFKDSHLNQLKVA